MGGIKKGQYHVAWTGGEPKPNWDDGLVQPDPKHIGQFQRCYEDGKAAIFGYERQRHPLQNKLSSIQEMSQFKLDVTNHLCEHGLDTIVHVPDPHDNTKMVPIIDSAGKFTVTSCEAAMKDQLSKYDNYDHENDQSAVTFLMGSLTIEHSESVCHRCNKTGS